MSESKTLPRVLRPKEVVHLTGLSRTTLYRLADNGQFPRPVRLAPKRLGWRESEVVAWIESRPLAANDE